MRLERTRYALEDLDADEEYVVAALAEVEQAEAVVQAADRLVQLALGSSDEESADDALALTYAAMDQLHAALAAFGSGEGDTT